MGTKGGTRMDLPLNKGGPVSVGGGGDPTPHVSRFPEMLHIP